MRTTIRSARGPSGDHDVYESGDDDDGVTMNEDDGDDIDDDYDDILVYPVSRHSCEKQVRLERHRRVS